MESRRDPGASLEQELAVNAFAALGGRTITGRGQEPLQRRTENRSWRRRQGPEKYVSRRRRKLDHALSARRNMYTRPCPNAPLVMKQLLSPIFLFHLVQSFRFNFFFFFKPFFSTPGNFLTVRDPPYSEKLENSSECCF